MEKATQQDVKCGMGYTKSLNVLYLIHVLYCTIIYIVLQEYMLNNKFPVKSCDVMSFKKVLRKGFYIFRKV